MGSPERGETDAAERISQEIATIHEQSYGVAPNDVKTYLLEDAVLCVCDVDLLRHERLILQNGASDSVQEVRKAFQQAIGATFAATVEHMTGRRVIGFLSETHLEPPFAIEFFKLGPEQTSPTEIEREDVDYSSG